MDVPLIAGRYRRGARLGTGGMASVWHARDERTGRDVAVKMLHPHLAADDRQRARLRQEAAALTSIDDAHVLPVLDVVDDGDLAIVMPRVEGETLAERLAGGVPLAEAQALDVAIAVAQALAAAHAVGLVHRDVKPSNILLGADGVVRLMDFGIATDLDSTSELTADGVVGTLRYLAPERLLGEPATPATDVWGVGIVLLEMLSGRPVYPGASLAERLDAAANAIARPPDVSEEIWRITHRAADGDPARRYPDGAALAAALRDARSRVGAPDPEAVTAVIPSPAVARSAATAPPAGRRRAPLVAAAAIGVLVVAAGGLAALALDPGAERADGPAGSGDPIAAPALSTATPAPTPAPSAVSADEDGASAKGKDRGDGKGKGNGKGKGKDKP